MIGQQKGKKMEQNMYPNYFTITTSYNPNILRLDAIYKKSSSFKDQ